MSKYDFVVIGAGLIGLATARALQKQLPNKSLCILEKESEVGIHQSGNNSGVIHSGVYYKPGSLKSRNCTAGKHLLEEYCRQNTIPFDMCGKLIVATRESERTQLDLIFERAKASGVECYKVSPEEMREREPHVFGLEGLFVPGAGIVDYKAVSQCLAREIQDAGADLCLNSQLISVRHEQHATVLTTTSEEIRTTFSIGSAGLYADKIARKFGLNPKIQIVPFRGEYYNLLPESRTLCSNLIYPVPNLEFPFLGVHFTRTVSGDVECGPNAVLAMAREGYSWREWNLSELFETLSYRGFYKLGKKYYSEGLREVLRSVSKHSFLKSLQQLVPSVSLNDLEPGPAGVRAQAVTPQGTLFDDFLIERNARSLHVLNAPSPAATACFSIADTIVGMLKAD